MAAVPALCPKTLNLSTTFGAKATPGSRENT
jgi:hypothetical protein